MSCDHAHALSLSLSLSLSFILMASQLAGWLATSVSWRHTAQSNSYACSPYQTDYQWYDTCLSPEEWGIN